MENLNYLRNPVFFLDIPDCFEYIIKKHKTFTKDPPVQIYFNKNEKKIKFKIQSVYYLKLLTLKTMKLLESKEKR